MSRAITPTPDKADASGEIAAADHHAPMAPSTTELVPEVAPASRTAAWRVFDKIGLGKPKKAPGSFAAKAIVTAYRLLGFGILTAIVVVLVGYIATQAFYYVSTSWVVPTVVSASDEKVVALRAELATQLNARDRIAGELADAERAIEANQLFQLEFAKAIAADSSGKKLELERTKQLASAAASTRYSIKRTTDAYAANTAVQTNQELQAGLIDRTRALASKVQIAEISSQNLSLAERQAALEARAAELATTTKGLDALLDGRDAALPAVPYEILKIKKDYQTSKLELARAMASRKMLQKSLARQDEIIAGVRQSAYLRALEDGAVVAVVPYDNVGNIAIGAPLVACKVQMVLCHQVGTVLEILPGEVTFKHPHKSAELRGRMIELKLDEAGAAEKDVLFVGGAPLWL